MTTPPTIPPRVKYNETLADKWLEANKIVSTAPKVTDQVAAMPFNRHGIEKYGYNGSIIEWRGRKLMAYRYHQGTPATKLAIAELDDKWNVRHTKPLLVDGGGSQEDCALFQIGNDLYASWVQSNWPKNPPQCVCRYGKLEEQDKQWAVHKAWTPAVGKNDWTAMEKNWIPFPGGFIYSQSPKQIFHEIIDGEVTKSHEAPFPHWPWGTVKGGTPPVPFKGNLLSFAHSTLDNEQGQWRRRYYVPAIVREPVAPFKVIAMSKTPILRGSELSNLTATERGGCSHFKGNVVFPLGCIVAPEGFYVSVGLNDSEVAVLRVTEGELKL